jgi:phosphonate transport system substrate-binding protein
MNKHSVLIVLVGLVMLAVIIIGGIILTRQREEPLVFVNIPAEDAVGEAQRWQPFMDYLSQQLGREVELYTVSDYAAVVEALKYGHADIARLGSTSYILAEEEANIISIASLANADGSLMTFQSYILARPDLQTLEDATFAFVDAGSTTGYVLPMTYILKSNIQLGEIIFAGSHPAVIEAVKNGSVDAGATNDTRWILAVKEGVIGADELVILWQSGLVPRGPTVIRADLPKELRMAIQEAIVGTPPEIVQGLGLEAYKFGPAPPDLYDPIREAREYVGLTE